MPGLTAGLVTALTQEQRAFVARSGRRRTLPTVCHVGHPAAAQVGLPDERSRALRTDLVERALDGLEELDGALAWLTRGGDLAPADVDMDWAAAAREAFARHGRTLGTFVVMTRRAWVDLVSGERREWRRVRPRSSAQRPS